VVLLHSIRAGVQRAIARKVPSPSFVDLANIREDSHGKTRTDTQVEPMDALDGYFTGAP